MNALITQRRIRLAAMSAAQSVSPDARAALAISAVRAYPMREPVSRRAYTVVAVETRSGGTGYGECGTVSQEALASAQQVLTGQPATAYEVLGRRLAAHPGVRAATNMALLDIVGKHAKAPVYQLLGGPTRNKARALATLDGASNGELTAAMRRAYAAGFRAFLAPVPPSANPNQGQAFVKAVRARLDSLRAAASGEVDFVLDGGGRLTPGDSASIAAALERFHLLWFDEPCRIANLATIRKIASESVTPLGFGRHIHEGSAFQDLLREDAVDILRPSISRNGISQIRRMAVLAETYYIAVAAHHDGGPIATAATLHLAASLPNFFIQQIPQPAAAEDQAMRAAIAGADLERVSDGFATLPTGPGLGIDVSREALEKYKERAA